MKIPDAVIDIVFAPKKKILPSEWIESNVYLPKSVSRLRSGYIRLAPCFREIIDGLETDPETTVRVIRSGAQIGKTLSLLCVALYNLFCRECNVLLVLHNEQTSKECLENLRAIIQASPELRKLYRKERGSQSFNTLRLKNGAKIKIGTSGSAGSLRSTAAACVILDEVNAARNKNYKSEGDLISISQARANSYGDMANIWICSTPTNSQGVISLEYSRSLAHEWVIPCSHCGAAVILSWDQIKWEKGNQAEIQKNKNKIRWVCPKCEKEYNQTEFRNIRDRGYYIELEGQKAKSNRIKGYHISGLMSTQGLYEHVIKFMEAKDDAQRLNSFYNLSLGVDFHFGKSIKSADLAKCVIQTLTRPAIPEESLLMLAGIDVGKTETDADYIFHVVWTVLLPKQKFVVVDAQRLCGEIELIKALQTPYKTPSGRELILYRAFVDTGFQPEQLGYPLVRKNKLIIPVKGVSSGYELLRWGKNNNKDLDILLINKQKSFDHYFTSLEFSDLRFVSGLPDQFFAHLSAWVYSMELGEYVERNRDIADHYLDSLRYSLAGFYDDYFNELRNIKTWEEYEAKLLPHKPAVNPISTNISPAPATPATPTPQPRQQPRPTPTYIDPRSNSISPW